MTAQFQSESNTDYGGLAELLQIEQNLLAYNSDIISKLSRHFSAKRPVLEFGAGIGTLALEWARQTGTKPECLEIDARQQQMILDRGLVCYRSISEISKRYEGIYTSNVLEHIENDAGTLRELNLLLEDGGILAVYVPALTCLFSDTDRALGHYRRYEKTELIDKVTRSGFQVMHCQYVDVLGFFAWYASKEVGGEKVTFPSARTLRLYDRVIYPISKRLDELFAKRLFGKNLLLIAKKTSS